MMLIVIHGFRLNFRPCRASKSSTLSWSRVYSSIKGVWKIRGRVEPEENKRKGEKVGLVSAGHLENQWLITMGYFQPVTSYFWGMVTCSFELLGCPGTSRIATPQSKLRGPGAAL